jgi:hypothetical protein
MLTAGLDSTIRLWHVPTGRCLRTLFGHLEGVWSVAADTLRVVSGAEDRTVKIWDPRTGKCEKTFTGHAGPVICVGLSGDRLVSWTTPFLSSMLTFNRSLAEKIAKFAFLSLAMSERMRLVQDAEWSVLLNDLAFSFSAAFKRCLFLVTYKLSFRRGNRMDKLGVIYHVWKRYRVRAHLWRLHFWDQATDGVIWEVQRTE